MNRPTQPMVQRISTTQLSEMVAAGTLSRRDRLELIEGKLLAMAPIGTRHASVTGRLFKRLILDVGDAATVRAANPVELGDFSAPEPDLVVLKPKPDDYLRAHPRAEDVLLLIEVADSSLAFDLGAKRDLYAQHLVQEYWIVDLSAQRILVHRDPGAGAFREIREILRGDSASALFGAFSIPVAELFAS